MLRKFKIWYDKENQEVSIMSSLKDVEQYKAIIITMDDLIFNLNELRYDFSMLLYPKTFSNISYQDYTRSLGTVNSMYSFVQENVGNLMNQKIESFVYAQKNLHNIRLKESADALLNFAKSKQLKVIVLTTHDVMNAKQLLSYRHLSQDIDQVISLSDVWEDLPTAKIFYTLKEIYSIELEEMLVVSSLTNIFKSLQYTPIDTIFVPDNDKSYYDPHLIFSGVMNTLFDVLQYFLFGKYTSADIYKDFLGYDENMDEKQKASRYAYLKMKYENQPEILPIVDEVFSTPNKIEIGEMTKEFNIAYGVIEKELEEAKAKMRKKMDNPLSFEEICEKDTSREEIIEEKQELIEEVKELDQEDITENPEYFEDKLIFDQTQEFTLDQLDQTRELLPVTESIDLPKDDKIQKIFDQLENKESSQEVIEEATESEIDLPKKDELMIEEEKLQIGDIILSGVFNLLSAIMIVSIGGILYMCFYDMVEKNMILRALFDIFVVGFAHVSISMYEFIVQPLPILSVYNATSVSIMFKQYVVLILVVFILLSVYKSIQYLWHQHHDFEE